MSKLAEVVLCVFVAILPSWLKISLLRRKGAKIGKGCRIGFSVVNASTIEIGDFVSIGHFNLIWRLDKLTIETGAAIVMFNWITGARTGCFRLGKNSGVTRLHFLEASGDIDIGENSIIAGRNTHLFTHGISSVNLDDKRRIVIGDWCYVGSGSKFVPGASVSSGTFVGMGSVVTNSFYEKYLLVAGAPATIKKTLNPDDQYFSRSYLPQAHHPVGYQG